MTFLQSGEALVRVVEGADGFFLIPAGPSLGTVATASATGDTYGAWVEMVASTSAALYIIGAYRYASPTGAIDTYCQLDIGTGAGASESSIGEVKFLRTSGTAADGGQPFQPIFPALTVAASTRIACRIAGSAAAANTDEITLLCINQADVEGVAV